MTDSNQFPDPLDLPIFGESTPPNRQGRVRSTWRYPGTVPPPEDPEQPEPEGVRITEVPATVVSLVNRRPKPDTNGLDWKLVAKLRVEVSQRLSELGRGTSWDKAEQHAQGWAVIRQVLDEDTAEALASKGQLRPAADQEALAQAVFDSVFRLGRLQPLIDDDRVENILITGSDKVIVEHSDGTMHDADPVADSDQQLVDFIAFLANRADNPRPFDPANPSLHLTLDGGARLAAALDTARPTIVIRRHRIRRVRLADLVDWGSLSPVMADFLRAAVKARLSLVVSGAQGAGKTTLVRALCAEIPYGEVVGTFETEYELFLHELEGQHIVTIPWEARPGFGERGADGRPVGQRTTDAQVHDAFRFWIDREIVGEVRGAEVWAMIKVMESGSGSISTTHASSAQAAMHKLITCAMEAGGHIGHELAAAKLAGTLDLIVHLQADTDRTTKRRYVSEILEVTPGEWPRGFALTNVFRRLPGHCGVAAVRPDSIWDDLVAAGLDGAGFEREAVEHPGGLR